MSILYANIELINSGDLAMFRRKYMDPDEVKRIHVNMRVDTGSMYMLSNEWCQFTLNKSAIHQAGQLQLLHF